MRVLLLLLLFVGLTSRPNPVSTDPPPSTSTGEPKLDCSTLCSGSDHDDNVGDCCSTQYCHCSEEGDSSQRECENGEKFCPALGECRDQYGEECQERPDCCTEGTTSTSTLEPSSTSLATETSTPSITSSRDTGLYLTQPVPQTF